MKNSTEPKIEFEIGTHVNVESRTWPGINKSGGVGEIIAKRKCEHNRKTLVDVKYILGGTEKDIDIQYVNHYNLFAKSKKLRNGTGTAPTVMGMDAKIEKSPAASSSSSSSAVCQLGSLQVKVGAYVTVQSRTWPGINKPGGVGRMTAQRKRKGQTLVDVRYTLGGVEKNIEMKYVQYYDLGKSARRGGGRSSSTSTSSSSKPLLPRFAYVNEKKMEIIAVIDSNTTHPELGKVLNFQKKHPLAVYQLEYNHDKKGAAEATDTDKDTSGNRLMRKLLYGETIPYTYGSPRHSENAVSIRKRAIGYLRDEILEINEENPEATATTSKRRANKRPKLPSTKFTNPSTALLRSAHNAIHKLLPEGDCEPFASVEVANQYYEYLKPSKVKIILLAESHSYTSEEDSKQGGILDVSKLPMDWEHGPREYVSLVCCPAYGETEILTHREGQSDLKIPNSAENGTSQFWKLLETCSGVNRGKPIGDSILKETTAKFQDRIRNKVEVLLKLKERGIWLLDTSIVGWHITQPAEFNITRKSNKVHKLEKARPPAKMKTDTLLLSWELYMKHVVRNAAKEGHLRTLIPIGNDVKRIITRDMLEEAVTFDGSKAEAARDVVHKGIPAPNAWIKEDDGGYHGLLRNLQSYIDGVLGPSDESQK